MILMSFLHFLSGRKRIDENALVAIFSIFILVFIHKLPNTGLLGTHTLRTDDFPLLL